MPAQGEGDQEGHFRFVQWHLGDDLSHNALDIFKGLLLIYYGFHLCVFMGFVSVFLCVYLVLYLCFFSSVFYYFGFFFFSVPVCLLEGEKSVGLSRWGSRKDQGRDEGGETRIGL